ncbi:MAG: iron-sulfur cluster assembly scaffold protein [Deltaproteobacteria bacterium]|nr:iron-sulfur cluster assembly scaffold protein [Deltaproteobacteria bacterium]MBW2218518.1 iron-sulfur cluster assembly scaffold protein [Deltaproteobacteria bacterium]
MNNDLDSFLDNLQEQIFDEAKDVLGEEGFQRWLNPRYRGAIENSDAHARIKGTCGDTMEIFLKFEDNQVKDASYLTDGCASSNVCGSFAAESAIGKSPDELPDITGKSIMEKLGNLTEEEEHCAFLAAETLKEALNKYMIKCMKKNK